MKDSERRESRTLIARFGSVTNRLLGPGENVKAKSSEEVCSWRGYGILIYTVIGTTRAVLSGFDRLVEVPGLIISSMIGISLGVKERDPSPDDAIRGGVSAVGVC